MENQEAYQRAKKSAGAKFGFYIHLVVTIAVSIVLVIINLSTST
jgi:tetrahydromethanopterin S-methyltransferase subunit G